KSGPDGNVYLLDWYDKQICHLPQPEVWDRTNGRIYKISYKDSKPIARPNLVTAKLIDLVKLQRHENDWYARTARRLLQERVAAIVEKGKPDDLTTADLLLAHVQLEVMLRDQNEDERILLRALWALHAIGAFPSDEDIARVLTNGGERLHAWLVQLMAEQGHKQTRQLCDKLASGSNSSAVVRRAIASALPRLPKPDQW